MAENRWQRIKQWFVARDPDEVAREAYLLASERGEEQLAAPASGARDGGRLTHEPA